MYHTSQLAVQARISLGLLHLLPKYRLSVKEKLFISVPRTTMLLIRVANLGFHQNYVNVVSFDVIQNTVKRIYFTGQW